MARIPRRYIIEDQSFFHVTWKCHNNEFLLRDERVKARLYWLLKKYKKEYRIKIHANSFMDNHPHIIGYCENLEDFSKFFQCVNGCLARFINKSLGRSGQVMMDRFRSPKIQNEKHMLQALHYVDLNPVRAGICKQPQDYKWSSYKHHAQGIPDELIDPLPDSVQFSPEAYYQQNKLVLQKDGYKLPVFTKTYFIGTPAWVRRRNIQLYQSIMSGKSPPERTRVQI